MSRLRRPSRRPRCDYYNHGVIMTIMAFFHDDTTHGAPWENRPCRAAPIHVTKSAAEASMAVASLALADSGVACNHALGWTSYTPFGHYNHNKCEFLYGYRQAFAVTDQCTRVEYRITFSGTLCIPSPMMIFTWKYFNDFCWTSV